MAETIVGDGLFVACSVCKKIALMPYTGPERVAVDATHIRHWTVRWGSPVCASCREQDRPVAFGDRVKPGKVSTPGKSALQEEKVLGVMQSSKSDTLTLTVVPSAEFASGACVFISDSRGDLLQLDVDQFNRMTVHEILNQAGVPISD